MLAVVEASVAVAAVGVGAWGGVAGGLAVGTVWGGRWKGQCCGHRSAFWLATSALQLARQLQPEPPHLA